jgi:rhamnulokinase
MQQGKYLAFDFGAESGRAIIGSFSGGKIALEEIHRFPTGMMPVHGSYLWNIFRFYEEIRNGIKKCNAHKVIPDSLGIDTWGVDFALVGRDGHLIGLPYCYRDSRTDGSIEAFFEIVPREEVYRLTGIQFMQFNTLFQLFSMARVHSPLLNSATDLLFIPDIFNYLLTGEMKSEFSFATTSQLYNPVAGNWEPSLFKALGIDPAIMQEIVAPGTVIGKLYSTLSDETGIPEIPVVAVASHDTGSAIAAIPAEGKNWAYISSGTWSLMGIESDVPIISEKTLRYNITNEGGVEHTFRVLKNIMGLWLMQQCRSAWHGENFTYQDLVEMSKAARPFSAFIDPDDHEFLNPVDMPAAIAGSCRRSGQEVPADQATTIRIILECLALKYRYTLGQLREISPEPIDKIYIIGGGVQNEVLCQFTANACGIPVITGPAEGTALGNILVQAMAMGQLKSLAEIRKIIRNSFDSRVYEPRDSQVWEGAYEQFVRFLSPVK